MSRYVVTLDWDDAPHLSEQDKKDLLSSIPEYQREARSKGIPQLGSGAIYPIPESEIVVADFAIPEHFSKWYGMDVGWNATAVVWFAKNPDTQEKFIYSVYKQGKELPLVHAQAIKSRGEWIKGAIDPASRGRSQVDGVQLLSSYINEGLNLTTADNSVESGIYQVWQDLSLGKLKVFTSCKPWFEEVRLYRRDEKGKVVKLKDHLMDATRYGIMSEKDVADVQVSRRNMQKRDLFDMPAGRMGGTGWMR